MSQRDVKKKFLCGPLNISITFHVVAVHHKRVQDKTKMFVLAELKSTVKVHPSLFSKPLNKVAEYELNKKLANKVLNKSKNIINLNFRMPTIN